MRLLTQVAAEIERDRIAFLEARQERRFRAEKAGTYVDVDTQVCARYHPNS